MKLTKFNNLKFDSYKPGKHEIPSLKDKRKIIKLSANESALGASPKVKAIMRNNISTSKYPDYTSKLLRKQISLVSQETTLFDDTIKNNIKYANSESSDEEIIEVAKLSHCHDFIKNLPYKYDTLIGEDGVRLSGGEKQRISIARAMLKKSPIILLDEATSSLDAETEKKIQDALNILTSNKTSIVIAHRLSTILNSDNIYVIQSGNVVDFGKHEELLVKSKIYKNFYEKQIQK